MERVQFVFSPALTLSQLKTIEEMYNQEMCCYVTQANPYSITLLVEDYYAMNTLLDKLKSNQYQVKLQERVNGDYIAILSRSGTKSEQAFSKINDDRLKELF